MVHVILYEGNNAEQDIVQEFTDYVYTTDLRENDEARSAVLLNCNRGITIQLYNSRDGANEIKEGWCRIIVKQFLDKYVVASFQQAVDDNFIRMDWGGKELDGKVSTAHIYYDNWYN